jgi:hypothetical protein
MPKVSASRREASASDIQLALKAYNEQQQHSALLNQTRRVRVETAQHGDDGDILFRHPFPEDHVHEDGHTLGLRCPRRSTVYSNPNYHLAGQPASCLCPGSAQRIGSFSVKYRSTFAYSVLQVPVFKCGACNQRFQMPAVAAGCVGNAPLQPCTWFDLEEFYLLHYCI